VLAAAIVGSSMAFIDGSVVNIALPVIQQSLGASIAELQWVVNGYLLPLVALMLVGGSLGDRIGRRRIFIAGIFLFTLASVAYALAPTVGVLIAARAAQGIGAALLVPQSLALIAANFPKDVRGRAIGTWRPPPRSPHRSARRRRVPDRHALLARRVLDQPAAGRGRPLAHHPPCPREPG
jgi:MFS family permease